MTATDDVLLIDLPKIIRTKQLDDGSTMFWLDNGSVWQVHPVTGPTRLREPDAAAGADRARAGGA